MSDPFALLDDPVPPPSEDGPGVGVWRLSARDHGAQRFLTPLGGEKFPTLIEAQQFAEGKWAGCSVWVLNDSNGQLFMREAGQWHERRRPHDPSWWKGKRRSRLGLDQAGRAR